MSATTNTWASTNTNTFNIKSTENNYCFSGAVSTEEFNSIKHALGTEETHAIEAYFSQNVILTTNENKKLSLDSIVILEVTNDQKIAVSLFFQGDEVTSISNTILFGVNPDQRNIHTYNGMNFTTTPAHPLHSLKKKRNIPTTFSIGTIILVLIFMGLIVFKKRNPIVFDRVSY